MKKKFFAICLCGLLIASLNVVPSGAYTSDEFEESAGLEELSLIVGSVARFEVEGLTKVAVNNPKIADIVSARTDEIMIDPKAPGITQLTYTDSTGEHKILLRVLEKDLDRIKMGIDEILANTGIQGVEARVNYDVQKVYLVGEVLNEAERNRLISALGPLGIDVIDIIIAQEEKVPIEIDVQAIELDRNDVDKLGVKWKLAPFTSIQEVPFGPPGPAKMSRLSRRATEAFRIGYTTRSVEGGNIQADINLLIQEGKAKILSRPKLVCLSGKEAEFFVGGEVPIVTITVSGGGGEGGSQTPNIEYKKYGITLKIRPKIRENGEIALIVNMEVSEIDEARSIATDTVIAPAFTTRTAETELYLNNNQTVFLAGLVSDKDKPVVYRMPFLSKIPLVGAAFRAKERTRDQIELVISLTPRIARPVFSNSSPAGSQQGNISVENAIAVNEYGQAVQRAIVQRMVLPEGSVNGKAMVTVAINSQGAVKQIFLKQPSGNSAVDVAIVEAIKRSAPFPVFPSDLKQEEIKLDIPIIVEGARQG